eukprot:601415-Rhodomonas_salina.1
MTEAETTRMALHILAALEAAQVTHPASQKGGCAAVYGGSAAVYGGSTAVYGGSAADIARAAARVLRDVWYWRSVCCYASATACPVPT